MFYNNDFKIGILGGGQLGRMFINAAIPYDATICILDPSAHAPCAHIAHEFVQGDFNDYDTVLSFGKDKDVLTIEIEHVNVDALELLEKQGVKVYPKPSTLRIVQDKGLQKLFYQENGIATSPFELVADKNALVFEPFNPSTREVLVVIPSGRGHRSRSSSIHTRCTAAR